MREPHGDSSSQWRRELEYAVTGSGEPVLFISPVVADGFAPLVAEPSLRDHYQLIRYHKRGWVGSTHTGLPVSLDDHAADAAARLAHLGVGRAHIAGHSSGAAVAARLAINEPTRVATLVLLELSTFSLPNRVAFLAGAGPVFDAFGRGAHEEAVAMLLSTVSGLEWVPCRELLDARIPGAVESAVKDADTFFGVELPTLAQWSFGSEQAAAIHQPVLSVLGSDTEPLWVEIAAFLRASLPSVEERTIPGVGHFLHMQQPEPVAAAIAEFLARNPISNA